MAVVTVLMILVEAGLLLYDTRDRRKGFVWGRLCCYGVHVCRVNYLEEFSYDSRMATKRKRTPPIAKTETDTLSKAETLG